MSNKEKKRSIVKSITWRTTAATTTMILVLVFTGKIFITLEGYLK